MTPSQRRPWNSAARIDATTIILMVDKSALQATLAARGVDLIPFPGAPPGRHPLCIDLWHVVAGRFESAGVDQHTWSETTGAATGSLAGGYVGAAAGSGLGAVRGAEVGARMTASFGPVAEWWGTTAGWLAGSLWGSARGATVGVAQSAALGGGLARAWSEAISRTLRTYDEAVVGVPNAVRTGGRAPGYMFVLGMCSNDLISIWGDRALGFGYRKCLVEISRQGFHRYEIRHGDATPPSLTAVLAPGPEGSWGPPDTRLEGYRALFARPVLGYLSDDTFAVSFLDRFFDEPELRWAPVSGRLSIADDFIEGVPGGEFDVAPLSPTHPWGAFQAKRVFTKVTDPERA